jgi:fibronectin-binding autotransporter adhesin
MLTRSGIIGGARGIVVSLTAPVLAWISSPTQNSPQFTIDIDRTIVAGDTVRLQMEATGGSWSSLVSDTTHTITTDEFGVSTVNLNLAPLANATYDARVDVTHGAGTSAWSNVVSGTILLLAAPTNTVAPVVSGNPSAIGNIFSTTDGSWTGTYPITPTYQWQRGGAGITGATSSTYALQSADAGLAITCSVTETDSQGNATQVSNAITVGVVPANTVAPVISGAAQVGNTLSSTTGTWTGTATITFSYQWQRVGVNISAATSSTYTLVSADDTHVINCLVTGTSGWGSTSGASNNLTCGTPPVNTVPPAVSGTAGVGYALTTTTGTWTGSPTYAYQWRRDGATNITGATSSTYTLVSGDAGHTIDCYVTATNISGAVSQDSNLTGSVLAAPTVSFIAEASFPSGSATSTRTWTGANIGTASATRRVICAIKQATSGVSLSTTASDHSINGVACDRVDQISSGLTLIGLVSAVVQTGTTGNVVVKFTGGEAATNRLEVYNVDDSLLTSHVPVLGSSSGSTTTDTATVATLGGGFVILNWVAAAGGTGPSVTASTNAMTSEGAHTLLLSAHANNVTPSASWSATVGWTTNSTTDQLLLAAYR